MFQNIPPRLRPNLSLPYTEGEMRVFTMISLPLFLFLGCVAAPDVDLVVDASDGEPMAQGEVQNFSLLLTPRDGKIDVQWLPPQGVTQARVYYRKTLPGEPWTGTDASNGPSPLLVENETLYTLDGLSNGEVYYVAVSLFDAGEWSAISPAQKTKPERAIGARVWVPPGVFTMGSSPGISDSNESPAHPVYVDGFWMDRYVASNAEFRACVAEGVCKPPAQPWGYIQGLTFVTDYYENPLYAAFPVVFLEYQEARDYCGWRGMRLPTEAEWEYAARGNREEPGYPWGLEAPTCDMANFNEDSIFCEGGPLPVGSFSQNMSPFGAVEMGGNVWEWTSDWYGESYYEESPCRNPQGPETGMERVLRGGAWYYSIDALSVTYRNTWAPTFLFIGNLFGDYRGFGVRCVESAPDVPCDTAQSVCVLPETCDEAVDEDAHGENEDALEDVIEPSDLGGEREDVLLGDALDGDSEAEEDADSGDSESEDGSELDGGETSGTEDTEPAPCTNPQDEEPENPGLCFDPFPGICPSGWTSGCEVKACHCAIGMTAEPGECGEELMTVSAGWRDYDKNFTLFDGAESMEICEGFQGGVHLAAVFKVEAPQMMGEFFYADLFATLHIDGVRVAGYAEETVKLEKDDTGLYSTKLEQIRFEGCLGDAYAGESAILEVLVRDKDGGWGKWSVSIPLVNEVEGPFLDLANEDPC